jgi:UDP-N-acetylmuramate--alanine ligase
LPFYGFAIACIDNKNVRDLVAKIKNRKVITYGIDSEDANVRAFDIELFAMSSKFSVRIRLPNSSKEVIINDVCLPIPGSHNILNSLSAISIAMELDFEIENIKDGFKNFGGVKRRFTKTGEIFGVEVFDDYAHHPEEIISTLRVAKNYVNERSGRVVAIFQPHRYSRLESLFNEFANSFDVADEIYITDIYSAGEQEIIGYNHSTLVKKINSSTNKNALYLDSFDTIINEVLPKLNENDLILFMGAGSITNWAYELPEYTNKITKHLKTATLL